MEKEDLKEKLIVLGISIGVFLPIRVLFSSFVTDNWLGSLGVMSGFAIVLVFFVKKGRLGWFGKMFERQMRKTMVGRTGKFIFGFAIFFLLYFGATLFFIERGNTIYFEDKEVFYLAIMTPGEENMEDISAYQLIGPKLIEFQGKGNIQTISNLDYMFSIAYAVMNDMSDGWLSHIVVVMFVEQIEVIGLIFLFRKTFKKIPSVQPKSST